MAAKKMKDTPKRSASRIGFEDIVGHKKVIERLRSIIKMLKDPKSLEHFQLTPPRGLLIYGPESVGKSMLAKAFAKEAGMQYIEISGSKLFDMDYVKEAYRTAASHAPCMVILEEIDIKGLLQGSITNVSFSDISKVMDLTEAAVFTIATSVTLEDVDPVLTAPNRLDFLIEVSRLDKDARRFFLEKILQKPHDNTIDVNRIVRYISGMGAMELERLGRMAALSAVEQGLGELTEEILIEQINIIKYGHKIEESMVRNLEEEMRMTAYHEAGHAVLSSILLPHIKIEQVTISPRSKMLGFVSYSTEEQITNVTKEEIFFDICVLLAGRLSKIKKAGSQHMDSGATNDLSQASYQAYIAIANLGMDKVLGFVNIDSISAFNESFLSETIEKRFTFWMETARDYTEKLVEEHWNKIDKLALMLIDKEIVEEQELIEIVGKEKVSYQIPEIV